ncbi:hypothetical protein NA57DRAFT_37087 [Rhizodiscina lignyota]|uniref:Uncharacterized protein n=1 Tax=Rhizodiscina lignyota TaxID=1504668 RepID=A0A9P4IGB9_9PEZI|nr:hypothetical protein NA57DRAFT_37087 [Rhizodiscina lignyota]
MSGSAPLVPALPAGAAAAAGIQNPNVTFNHIQDTAAKRINTLDYLRKAHEGRIYWFNTLLFTSADLRRLPSFEPRKLARRATNYLLLGFSLPQILDLNSQTPLEFLRALNALFAEFETYQSLHPSDGSNSGSLSRARIPNMFKRGMQAAAGSSKSRRASSATDIGFTPPGDVPEPTSAVSSQPPMGFPPPVSSTTIPSADPAFSAETHLPSESYSLLVTPSLPFDPDFAETFATLCDVLIDVYRGIVELVNVPEKVGPGIGELFTKADARVRKILVAGIVREFEDVTRTGVKQEVGGVGRVVLGGLM